MKLAGLDKSIFANWGWGDAYDLQRKANLQIAEIAVRETLKTAVLEIEAGLPNRAILNVVMFPYDDPVTLSFAFADICNAIKDAIKDDVLSVEHAAKIKAELLKAAAACDKAEFTHAELFGGG